jgi:prolyl oligopeptidase
MTVALAATITVGIASAAADVASGPPVAPVRPVTDTYFGTPVVDNYRYMENLADPEVQRWMRGQADYARAALDRLPGRAALLDRIHELANADTRRSDIVRRGERYFYLLTEPGVEQPRLACRDGLEGKEKVLVDPIALGKGSGGHYAIDWYSPSWDGRYVVYGLSEGGSEASTLRVLEVATGKVLQEGISRTESNVVSWRKDNRSFFYLRYAKPTPATPKSELLYNARTYLHTVGERPDGDGDPVVFGRGVSKSVEVPEGQGTYVIGSADSAYAIAVANHNMDENPATLYVAPVDSIRGPATPWRKIADVADGVTAFVLRGDTLYFQSHKGAPHSRILATPLAKPDVNHARVVVPESDAIVTSFDVASDGLYHRAMNGALSRIVRTSFDGRQQSAVPLPFEGNVFGPVTDPAQPGALFGLQSWTQPPQLYRYDPAGGRTTNTGLIPASAIDTSGLESKEVLATSYDGTRVPLSIIYRRGLVLDGSHPTVLEGYGSYGMVSESAFRAARLAWIERGGVIAIAHIRGGGELGETWHQEGQFRKKPNTILDFVACGEYLVDAGYTSPRLLAGRGGSAGGITVGGAMTWRPGLFGVILDHVGMSDLLRYETEPNGPPNVPEFGSVSTKEGFHGLYAMSAYAHVRDGTPYPAVMFLTGANDPRVSPWHMAKMAARVQAATSSGRPVLLRIDYEGGHGIGSTRSQSEQELADVWSFALWQMGDPAFQPQPAH